MDGNDNQNKEKSSYQYITLQYHMQTTESKSFSSVLDSSVPETREYI